MGVIGQVYMYPILEDSDDDSAGQDLFIIVLAAALLNAEACFIIQLLPNLSFPTIFF